MGRAFFARVLLLSALGMCRVYGQTNTVHAWLDSIQLPTYPENDPDPNPQYSLYGQDNPNYPYPLRVNITRDRRAPQNWRTLNLENEYLLCRVMPDLGGHLYNCRDKRNGREVFYANPVVKKDLVGLRGAWVAMGIESNFPAAHSRDSASPVDFAVETDPDGSGRATVKDIDRVTGMEWRVEYILRPGSTALEQRVTFYNRGTVRRPYDWWSNAGVALDDEGTRIILPAHLVATHGTSTIRPWPAGPNGIDDSLVAGHKDQFAWFAYGSKEPFMAVYKPASRTGLAHFADPAVVAGKKLWYWGSNSDEDVKRTLTDGFPSYIEIQAGLFQDQETFHFLEPEEVKSFSESWIPVYDLGGVSRVTADAIVNLQRTGDGSQSIRLEISATHAIAGATIRVLRDATVIFEAQADLDPAKTYSHTIENPGAAAVNLQVLDSKGKVLVQHAEGQFNALTSAQVNIGQQPPPDWSHSLETETYLLARGEYNELSAHPNLANSDYRHGLALFPSSVPIQKADGRLLAGLDRADDAASMLLRVVSAAPSDAEAEYLLGVAEALGGHDEEAQKALAQVPGHYDFADAAALQLTYIAARAKDYAGALAALKPLLIPDASRPARPGAFEVALLRRSGQTEEARKRLAVWRALDPADTMLRIEASLLGADDPELWTHLGEDAERVLNFADEYLKLGMIEDALTLLAHPYPSIPKEQLEPGAVPPGASPLVAYYRAYCHRRLNQDRTADLRLASSQSTRFVFPFRASSFTVLNAAIDANPADATAHFLLGRLLLNRLATDAALVEWRKAQALEHTPPELTRELTLLTASLKNDTSPAAAASGRGTVDLTHLLPGRSAEVTKSPLEVAISALLQAGAGQSAQAVQLFDPAVFKAEKQPNEVRRAYIEVQLQAVMGKARSGPPLAVLAALDKLGAEDTNLPFTFNGFNAYFNAPHFEYFSALVEAACRDEKASRKRWTRISKMSAPLGSPEYAYPLLSASRIAPEEAKPKIAAALASVREAMGKANEPSRSSLQFSEAMLLHAAGQEGEAAGRLEKLAHESTDSWIQYLALVGLREVLDGKQ